MKSILVIAFATIASTFGAAHCYEVRTHEDLSEAALAASLLKMERSKRERIGLRYDLDDGRQRFGSSASTRATVTDLVRRGARFEDDVLELPPRSINHFFDPSTGKPLSIEAPAFLSLVPDLVLQYFPDFNASTVTSPDWALDGVGEYTIGRTIDGQNRLIFFYIVRDDRGIWRLDSM